MRSGRLLIVLARHLGKLDFRVYLIRRLTAGFMKFCVTHRCSYRSRHRIPGAASASQLCRRLPDGGLRGGEFVKSVILGYWVAPGGPVKSSGAWRPTFLKGFRAALGSRAAQSPSMTDFINPRPLNPHPAAADDVLLFHSGIDARLCFAVGIRRAIRCFGDARFCFACPVFSVLIV